MVQGGMSLVKYLIFGFNLLFVIMGIVLIVVGGITINETSKFGVVIGNASVSAAVLVIVTGVFIFLIAFFGCCGAIRENHCMTITFSVLLFIILVLEIAAAASAYVFRDSVGDTIRKNMNETMKQYKDGDKIIVQPWDEMQLKLQCCGITNATDWIHEDQDIPVSCCKENVKKFDMCPEEHQFTEGCLQKLEDNLKKHALVIAVSVIIFLFIQILGIVCACCLANAIKKQYEVV